MPTPTSGMKQVTTRVWNTSNLPSVCVCERDFPVPITHFVVSSHAATELYSSVLSEAVVDWGSMGSGEEWVNSATREGEQGKTRLSTINGKRDSTLNLKNAAAAHRS